MTPVVVVVCGIALSISLSVVLLQKALPERCPACGARGLAQLSAGVVSEPGSDETRVRRFGRCRSCRARFIDDGFGDGYRVADPAEWASYGWEP